MAREDRAMAARGRFAMSILMVVDVSDLRRMSIKAVALM